MSTSIEFEKEIEHGCGKKIRAIMILPNYKFYYHCYDCKEGLIVKAKVELEVDSESQQRKVV